MPMGSSFYVEIDKSKGQLGSLRITVSESVYEIRIPFESKCFINFIQIIHIAIPLLQQGFCQEI
jgi:hypothetical protein